jgi:sec-independent protein translocase protein TatA
MFGVGMPELMIIFVIALLVFGPKELPKIAKTLGKAMAELRRASDELRDGIQREIETATREEKEPPASPPEAVPSSPVTEASLPPAGMQESVQAEAHGAEPATIGGIAGNKEQVAQEAAGATLPVAEGQTQPAATESTSSPGQPAQPAETHGAPEQSMKETAQAETAEAPKEGTSLSEAVPHVSVKVAETRNA